MLNKRPDTFLGSLALILLLMGGMFILFGFSEIKVLLCGICSLALGGALQFLVVQKKAKVKQLIAQGTRVPAKILSVRHHTTLNLSFSKTHGRAAFRSPWTVYCSYEWQGKTYSTKTNYLNHQPWDKSPDVEVCLDPAAPDRGVVDPDTIRYVQAH